jgi:hypothetical protein
MGKGWAGPGSNALQALPFPPLPFPLATSASKLCPVDRLNSQGIPRDSLKFALGQRRIVMAARRTGSCMLCRRRGVNETGLCDVCYSLLDDPEELRLANRWLTGEGP